MRDLGIPTTDQEVGRTLMEAASYLLRHGWTQGEWFDLHDRASAEGAIYTMAGSPATARASVQALAGDIGCGDLDAWHDAPERTKAEIVSALQRAGRARLGHARCA
jgi:hypothetical protein